MRAFWAIGVTVAVASACEPTDDAASIVVEVQTDWVPGQEFGSVRVALSSAGSELRSEALDARRGPADEEAFRQGRRVAELDGLRPGTYRMTVTLIEPSGDTLASRTVELPLEHETLGLRVVLARACADDDCPGSGAAELTECVANRCADARCRPGRAERCPLAECTSNADCSAAVACADAVCGPEGGCLTPPDSTRCPAGTFCHPEEGCIEALPEPDAGPPDAGPPDAGVDAFVPWDPDMDPALVAWFRFDESTVGPSTMLADSAPSGLDGACGPLASCPMPVVGTHMGALRFDGIDDRVRITHAPVLLTTAGFTVAAWVRFDELGGSATQTIAAKPFASAFRNSWQLALLDIDGDTELELVVVMDTSGGEGHAAGEITFGAGEWLHVACTWDGTALRLYLGGVELDASGGVADALFDSSDVLVGADEDGGTATGFLDGTVDDLRIYSRALTPDELARL